MALLTLGGCQAGYYAHLLQGQLDLVQRRQPIHERLQDPALADAYRARLLQVQSIRQFAIQQLSLPDSGSYRQVADLERPWPLWNVYAAPELSLVPHQWCHLLVGCMAYRGYFAEALAREEAARLQQSGWDVHVAAVSAYSTLGWFDDPVLASMLEWPEDQLAGTLFHELAHERLYTKGDTAFNESFARFVERAGLNIYLQGRPQVAQTAAERMDRTDAVVALMLVARNGLESAYAETGSVESRRNAKLAVFAELQEAYAQLRRSWGGDVRFDAWFAGPWNNARLLPFGLYHQWVPAFAELFRQSGSDWATFFQAAETLAELPAAQRHAALLSLGAAQHLPPP